MLSLTNLETTYASFWKENQKHREQCQQKIAKRDKLIHIRKQINQGVEYPAAESHSGQFDRCAVELAVLQLDINTEWKKECKTWKQMDSLLFVNRANTTYKKWTAKNAAP